MKEIKAWAVQRKLRGVWKIVGLSLTREFARIIAEAGERVVRVTVRVEE